MAEKEREERKCQWNGINFISKAVPLSGKKKEKKNKESVQENFPYRSRPLTMALREQTPPPRHLYS